ncbi:MAG: hypothetical protein N4A62_12275 [Marinisporobacter sp.]|nr:hypothetical protein [Marinisporobacter sp.]
MSRIIFYILFPVVILFWNYELLIENIGFFIFFISIYSTAIIAGILAGLYKKKVKEGKEVNGKLDKLGAFISNLMSRKCMNMINDKIAETGGNVISIDEDDSYIEEVDEIEKKDRYNVYDIFKVKYSLENKEKVIYLVEYKKTFNKRYHYDWVDKPEELESRD